MSGGARIGAEGRAPLLLLVALFGCRAPEPAPLPIPPPTQGARLHHIVVAGERIPTEAPVVLWDEPPHYDAHSEEPRFASFGERGPRHTHGRRSKDPLLTARVEERGWDLEALRQVVDQFVLHYDTCGTSRECFRVLQDARQLSVHFLLDLDGTVYQTLDLMHQAWHARQANARSIGIEIAQVGAYPPESMGPIERWYERDESGRVFLRIPESLGDGGQRTPAFRGSPARDELVLGRVNGTSLAQYDFTPEQYDSLVKLTATLVTTFPRILPEAPRALDGTVRADVLAPADFDRFGGILGHNHVSSNKVDPGPAFQWDAFLAAVRQRLPVPEP